MYHVTIVNNYAYNVFVDADNQYTVQPGQTFEIPVRLGNAHGTVPGIGHILFKDVADRHIGGWSKRTWGVYVAYQGEEMVFRYEGEGQLRVELNELGQAVFSGGGDFAKIDLGAIVLPQQ